MEYLNIPISLLKKPEYVGSEPEQRATWLNLMTWSAHVENSGRIVGCKNWKDRQWQQTCGVTLSEVQSLCDLWTWEGDDLVLWEYPVEQEKIVKVKRLGGKKGAEIRWNKPPDNDPDKCHEDSQWDSHKESSCEKERKGKEGKEKEGGEERAGGAAHAPAPDSGEPVDPILTGLSAMWPHAEPELDAGERRSLAGNRRLLAGLTPDDWQLLAAWPRASNKQRDQKKLWPRDRGEFLRNVSETLQQARKRAQAIMPPKPPNVIPLPSTAPPEATETLSEDERRKLFGMPPKPPKQQNG